jgi:hypothetical protein
MASATSCISAPWLCKPGGVVLAILGPWAQHIAAKTSRDDLGRWASATMTGSDGNSFTLISLYNVVNVQLQNAKPSTIFAQKYRLLRLAGVLIPNSRQQCIDDLHRTVAKMIANQEAVMIMGDFNESLGSDPRLMGSVCASHDLFDVISNFMANQLRSPRMSEEPSASITRRHPLRCVT